MEAPDKNIASELGDLNKYVTDDEQYKVPFNFTGTLQKVIIQGIPLTEVP